MGNDLYWKITPKPVEEETNGLYLSTWYFLQQLYGFEERDYLNGLKLTKDDLPKLEVALITADQSSSENMKELYSDLAELINAIQKYNSITLEIHG